MLKLILATFLTLGLASLGMTLPAAANPDFALGPDVGAMAPTIGTPPDMTGRPRSLDSLRGANGTVLFFFRSAAWCPYCQAQLIELNKGVAALEKRGYRLAGLSYDKPEILAAFAAERGLQYTLLSDPASQVIDRFGLRDPQYKPGSRAFGVPRPIILILDRAGVVKAKLYEANYQARPPLPLLLETLDKTVRN